MAKTIASLVGVVFSLVGIVGCLQPHLLGAHLGTVHNVIHLVSGAVSLYFGTKGTLGQARTFCIVFGLVYGLLGVVGFVVGELHLPGGLMLGKIDHCIHVLIALLYLIGGFATRPQTVTA